MRQALIEALAACHRQGSTLKSAEWAGAVRDWDDVYAVHDGLAAALGWTQGRWKSGASTLAGPYGHAPLTPEAARPLLGVEAEVALRIGRDVTPEDAQGPLDGVVDAMCVAVELIASRWEEGLAAPELLRLADNQSNAGLLLGPWQPWQPLDWAQLEWCLALPGQPDIVRRGGHALANPAAVVPHWLRHATRHGQTLRAGAVVTTGAWAGLHPLTAPLGGSLRMDGLGELSF